MTQVASENLFMLYSAITLLEQIIGAVLVIRTLLVWSKVYDKLTPVVKSYILVFVPDVVIVITYLARSTYGLFVRTLVVGEGECLRHASFSPRPPSIRCTPCWS